MYVVKFKTVFFFLDWEVHLPNDNYYTFLNGVVHLTWVAAHHLMREAHQGVTTVQWIVQSTIQDECSDFTGERERERERPLLPQKVLFCGYTYSETRIHWLNTAGWASHAPLPPLWCMSYYNYKSLFLSQILLVRLRYTSHTSQAKPNPSVPVDRDRCWVTGVTLRGLDGRLHATLLPPLLSANDADLLYFFFLFPSSTKIKK